MLAKAHLESLLRERKLDRTLAPDSASLEWSMAAIGIAALDRHLGGGLPRGQISEIAGPRSSGRTSLLLALLAAATTRGELVALVDTFDTFDAASAATAGIALHRLLWIRGLPGTAVHGTRAVQQSGVDRALKALNLVLQCGNFGVVAIDLVEVPAPALRQIPLTTWPRVQRVVEGSATACVLLGSEPIARSAAGLTLLTSPVTPHGAWSGEASRDRLLRGLRFEVRTVRSRFRAADDRLVTVTTDSCRHDRP